MKVAKLVYWSPVTRVVVDENATYEEIVEAAKSKFQIILDKYYEESIERVVDDFEMPYNETYEL